MYRFSFFFFQAEDGIRDLYVTGVQTCALPILIPARGVIRTLPWVVDGDQSRCLGVTLRGEVAMPFDQPRVECLQARADLRPPRFRRQLPDPLQRQGMHRRLTDPCRLYRERRRSR